MYVAAEGWSNAAHTVAEVTYAGCMLLQKDGPDADDPRDDIRPDEDALDDCPEPDEGQVDGQSAKAELEIQKQVEKRFVTVSR